MLHVIGERVGRVDAWTPPPSGAELARPVRPMGTDELAPWFQLTPLRPGVDARVDGAGIPGAAALLECFGVHTGPRAASLPVGPEGAVLGGAPALPGSPAPADPREFSRSSCARLGLRLEGLAPRRQLLLLFALRGGPGALAQVFAGEHAIDELAIGPRELLPLVIDGPPAGGSWACVLHVRLAAVPGAAALLGIAGVQAHLL